MLLSCERAPNLERVPTLELHIANGVYLWSLRSTATSAMHFWGKKLCVTLLRRLLQGRYAKILFYYKAALYKRMYVMRCAPWTTSCLWWLGRLAWRFTSGSCKQPELCHDSPWMEAVHRWQKLHMAIDEGHFSYGCNSVSHQVLPLHTTQAGGYHHYVFIHSQQIFLTKGVG